MKVIIAVLLCLLLFCNTAMAEDWEVTWEPIKESIVDKEYGIAVQNLQDVKRDVNISSFFAETNFDISELSDVKFFEWGRVPYTYTAKHYTYIDHNDYNAINGTWNNWTESVYDYTETIESEKLGWEECKAQLFKETGIIKEDNYGYINIPKFGSEADGDGTYNGTKLFKLMFKTPIVYTDTYGSSGKVALLLDGEEHHPYWNTSWTTRKEVILTGYQTSTASLNNPIVDGHIYKPGYIKWENLNYFVIGINSSVDHIYRSYIEWDISSIPSDAIIRNVSLQYHGDTNNVDCHIHEMTGNRPSASNNQTIYDEAGEGTIYADIVGFPIVGTNQEIDLGDNAVSDLQSTITNGWFAVGIQADDEITLDQKSRFHTENSPTANPKPTLYVEYTTGVTDYQILLNVSYETGMQTDFDDLRFANNTQEIDSWLESKVDGVYALVWVEFPTTPINGVNQTYYMYYGNDSVSSVWDIEETFLFGDDFQGSSIDTGKWDGKTSNAAVSGGIMSYGGDNTQDSIKSISQFGANTACRSKIKFLTPFDYIHQFGLQNPANTHNSYFYMAYTPSNLTVSKDGTTQSTSGTNTPFGSWFVLDINVLGGINMSWFYDDVEGTSSPKTTNPSNANDLELFFVGRSNDVCIQSEWIIVRKYVSEAPTYTFGTVQYYANNIYYNKTNPYNHTIESDGTITTNRSIIPSDNIGWAAAALTDDCHFVVTEYNYFNDTLANFTIYSNTLDWLMVSELIPDGLYGLQYTNGTLICSANANANGEINFTVNLAPGNYQIIATFHPMILGAHLFFDEMGDGLTNFKDGMGKYLVWGIVFFAAGLAFTLFAKIKQTIIGGK